MKKPPKNPPPPTYDADSYASTLIDKSIYPDDTRIFHRGGMEYVIVREIRTVELHDGAAAMTLAMSDGKPATLCILPVADGIFRLTLRREKGLPGWPTASPMLAMAPEAKLPRPRLAKTADGWRIAWGKTVFDLPAKAFTIEVNQNGRRRLVLDNESVAGKLATPPLGFRQAGGRCDTFLSWHMDNRQRFFGLGEKWNKVEKTSTRATIWSCDTCGTNTNDMSYKSIPLLFSTAGWGLMLHSSCRSSWEIGTFNYTAGSVLVEDSSLDAFLFLAPNLKGLVRQYTRLTGHSAMPPRWAFGMWMSRCQYLNRGETDAVTRRLRQEHIPCDVIHLDPQWMKTHYYFKIGVDACDFDRNDIGFPDQPAMFREYARQGFAVCLWVNPYLPEGHLVHAEATRKGFLLKSLGGGVARLEHGQPVGIVDFTNPAAKRWWQDKLVGLLRDGAAVIKPDYGDRVPEDALGCDGKTGRELHNLYLHLYGETCFEAAREVHGQGLVWRRAGYIGTQRFPVTWSGDTQVSWEGLRGCMRGGLSAGFGGEAFWASDIGGFCGPRPDPELYIRWTQFGMFSPMCRFHGTSPREPWEYGPAALAIAKRYCRLRYRLVPYLMQLGRETGRNGMPLLRHMALEFPREPNIHTIDDQYMLGDKLLVAPVINPGERRRWVYFPKGAWVAFENPRVRIEGPGFHEVAAPLSRIPVFVKAGARIPMFTRTPQHLKGTLPPVTLVPFP